MRGLALAAVLAVSMPAIASAQPSCPEPTFETLWGAIPEARRSGLVFDEDITPRRVASIELDGASPAEAVLTVDSLISEFDSDLGTPRSGIFVLRCAGSAWSLVGRVDVDIDRGWDGTYDDRPGVVVLRAESLPGIGHDLARIEHVDVCGSHDPRFVSRRLMYLHVVDGAVVVAFDTVVRSTTERGPGRDEVESVTRSVVLQRSAPPGIRMRIRESHGGGPARQRCSTTLRFDGRTFVPADRRCL